MRFLVLIFFYVSPLFDLKPITFNNLQHFAMCHNMPNMIYSDNDCYLHNKLGIETFLYLITWHTSFNVRY